METGIKLLFYQRMTDEFRKMHDPQELYYSKTRSFELVSINLQNAFEFFDSGIEVNF